MSTESGKHIHVPLAVTIRSWVYYQLVYLLNQSTRHCMCIQLFVSVGSWLSTVRGVGDIGYRVVRE